MARAKSNQTREAGLTTAAPAEGQGDISPAVREKMIAEAAYFRAQARGFQGDPLDDWLAAEAEINRTLSSQSKQ